MPPDASEAFGYWHKHQNDRTNPPIEEESGYVRLKDIRNESHEGLTLESVYFHQICRKLKAVYAKVPDICDVAAQFAASGRPNFRYWSTHRLRPPIKRTDWVELP
jgi:hypothetical protein